MAVTQALLAEAGVTPLAGERFTYGPAPVVAGFVPGRVSGLRDTLVVVAARGGGPEAAVAIDAVRRLVERATRNEGPQRSVLVALWSPGRLPEQGLADVLAFPLWPRDAVAAFTVVEGVRLDAASAEALAARVTTLAARPAPSEPAPSASAPPSSF